MLPEHVRAFPAKHARDLLAIAVIAEALLRWENEYDVCVEVRDPEGADRAHEWVAGEREKLRAALLVIGGKV